MTEHSTKCLDWESRVLKGESLTPPPLFPAGRPRAKRDYESKRRSPLWKRNGDISLGDHCPKCGGSVEHNQVRLGQLANIDRCIMCGLTSESMSFYDAVNCRRVDIKTALVLMRLNGS